MHILAHRANWKGADRPQENTLPAVRFCLEQGWGIETDIRRAPDGRFYISHDLADLTEVNQADAFCTLIRRFPVATVALNIKELGYESDLLLYLSKQQIMHQVFLFDMELVEAQAGQTAVLFRKLESEIKLAARVSDRGESIERALSVTMTDIIWLDEFDHLWVKESDVNRLKSAGKTIYTISPEIHGFSLNEMQRRWREFHHWGVDGICTDYSMLLAQKLAGGFEEFR
jgi:hypothetical protein